MHCIELKEYHPEMHDAFEEFRRQAQHEGNDSLLISKFNQYDFDGKIWCLFVDGEMACISAAENDRYTGSSDIALRICRLHILKKFRPSMFGVQILKEQIAWAKEYGYKILYFTHDIWHRPMNLIYQHKKYPQLSKFDNVQLCREYHYSDWYMSITLDTERLFRVDPTSDFLQYIYYIDLTDAGYNWEPIENIVLYKHDGEIKRSELNYILWQSND